MLNFDVTKKCLVGEGWCPIFAKAKVNCYAVLFDLFNLVLSGDLVRQFIVMYFKCSHILLSKIKIIFSFTDSGGSATCYI